MRRLDHIKISGRKYGEEVHNLQTENDALKQQLNDLGVTDEQMREAVGNKNSSLCSIM